MLSTKVKNFLSMKNKNKENKVKQSTNILNLKIETKEILSKI